MVARGHLSHEQMRRLASIIRHLRGEHSTLGQTLDGTLHDREVIWHPLENRIGKQQIGGLGRSPGR